MASFQSASCTCFKDNYNEITIMYFFKIIGGHWWQGKQRSCWSPPEVVWSKLINILTRYMCTGTPVVDWIQLNQPCPHSWLYHLLCQYFTASPAWSLLESGQIFVVCVPQNSNWHILNTGILCTFVKLFEEVCRS